MLNGVLILLGVQSAANKMIMRFIRLDLYTESIFINSCDW